MEWALYFPIVKKKIHARALRNTNLIFFTSRAGPFVTPSNPPSPPTSSSLCSLQAIDIPAVNHNKFFSIILPMILNAFAAVSKLFSVQPNFFELHS
jgi:hypothetical protein